MQFSTSNNKFIGTLGILFGLFCFSPLFAVEQNRLIMHQSEIFIIRYFGHILLINAGVEFIVFGVLIYLGFIAPYFSSINKYEKAKHNLLAIILSIPFWLSISAVIFVMANTNLFKMFWIFVLICILLLLISSLKMLVGGRSTRKRKKESYS